LQTYKMAAAAASGEGDEGLFVEATAQAAQLHVLTGTAEEGRAWLESAGDRARPEHPAGFARWLIARGVFERHAGAVDEALTSFGQAYEVARAADLGVRAVQAAHWAAATATDERQVRWCRRALEAAKPLGDDRLVAALWTQLAWLLEERGLMEDALVAFQQAHQATLDDEDPHRRLVADWSLAHGLRIAGRAEEALALLRAVAERAERSYTFRRRPNDGEWVGHCEEELAEHDAAAGRFAEAVARLQRARRLYVQAGIAEHAPERLRELDLRLAQWSSRGDRD